LPTEKRQPGEPRRRFSNKVADRQTSFLELAFSIPSKDGHEEQFFP